MMNLTCVHDKQISPVYMTNLTCVYDDVDDGHVAHEGDDAGDSGDHDCGEQDATVPFVQVIHAGKEGDRARPHRDYFREEAPQ